MGENIWAEWCLYKKAAEGDLTKTEEKVTGRWTEKLK